MKVAIVHDSVAQRGGAERVLLQMMRAFPDAPIYTAIFDPDATYPEFGRADIRPLGVNRVGVFRRNHRLALPLLATAYSRLVVDADVVFCASWGWAHGARVTGRKVVYCYTPARWLYQSDRYVGNAPSLRRIALLPLRAPLTRWDRHQAATADRYLTLSRAVQDRITTTYHRDSEILPPPPGLTPDGPLQPVAGLEPGFLLCPSRFLPYKNVDAVIGAMSLLPQHRLVVVGTGPLAGRIAQRSGPRVKVMVAAEDAELRWLYQNCATVVSASYEDYGLTPLEGAGFGKPSAVLRWGGFLDTVQEGVTGLFFDAPEPGMIARAVQDLLELNLPQAPIRAHAARFAPEEFITRLHRIAGEEYALLGP